jgi:hypothetical protein
MSPPLWAPSKEHLEATQMYLSYNVINYIGFYHVKYSIGNRCPTGN